MIRAIALGAGVQSTTLYLMACAGEIEGVEFAIFSDTGWEPKSVYTHLERLKALGSLPIIEVSGGNIRDDLLSAAAGLGPFMAIPAFTSPPEGEGAVISRHCTGLYKINPLKAYFRERLRGKLEPGAVELMLGISRDEVYRMKESTVKYIRHRWPLIEKGMSRDDCKNWLEKAGWNEVPRSACIGCPFHSKADWEEMKYQQPEEFEDACLVDEAIRIMPTVKNPIYIHPSKKPLREVRFRDWRDIDDLDFNNECEGMCGL